MDEELRPQIRLSDVPPDLDTLLDDWISRFSNRSGHVQVTKLQRYDEPPSTGEWAQDVRGATNQTVRIYTDNNVYSIHARWGCSRTYLGCTASSRKPRAGEEHTRGSDLADGRFTYETWFSILADIVSYELVPIAKTRRPVADGHQFPSHPQSAFQMPEGQPAQQPMAAYPFMQPGTPSSPKPDAV